MCAIPGVRDVALTTNGVLLARHAQALYDAGLRRLNVHLDTLDRERFLKITRRDDLGKVLDGIETAQRVGFGPIKINAVAVKNLVEPDIVPLARYGREQGIEIRFIEFMPLDSQGLWARENVLSADEIIETLSREISPLVEIPGSRSARAGHRVSLRRRRGERRIHRFRHAAVLPQLQSHSAYQRRQAAVLPVRDRGDGRARLAAHRRSGCRNRRRPFAGRSAKSGWGTRSTPPSLSLRRARCTRSGVSATVSGEAFDLIEKAVASGGPASGSGSAGRKFHRANNSIRNCLKHGSCRSAWSWGFR